MEFTELNLRLVMLHEWQEKKIITFTISTAYHNIRYPKVPIKFSKVQYCHGQNYGHAIPSINLENGALSNGLC